MAAFGRRHGKWQSQISFKGRQKAKSFTDKGHEKALAAE